VEEFPDLARRAGAGALWVKREDLNGPAFGGNKLRALEFLLPRLGATVVTMGGYGSTWCAALARTAADTGRRAEVALFPQPWNVAVAGALAATSRYAGVHLARSRWRLPGAVRRAWKGACRHARPNWLAAGGAEPHGVLGSVNAGLEFCRQVAAGAMPPPDAVVVPLGSGGTAAGLLLGFWLGGMDTEVCAVGVTDPWFANRQRVLWLARRTGRLLRRLGCELRPGAARLRVLGGHLGAGYGHPTVTGEAARAVFAEAGLTVDSTYGAKACAALRSLAASFPHLCFWHTFDHRLVAGAPLDSPLLREARALAESLWPHPRSI
jgi:D-cysteine desulfhydrase